MSGHEGGPGLDPQNAGSPDPVEDAVMSDVPAKPTTPERFRAPRFAVYDGLMGDEFGANVGAWLFHNRDRLKRAGVGDGRVNDQTRIAWCIRQLESVCPHTTALRAAIFDRLGEACEALEVPTFDPAGWEWNATLHHHGCFYGWHRDVPGAHAGEPGERVLSFVYYLHSTPKLFSGGELEFQDGTLVSPDNDRLVIFPSEQRHQVRLVECWAPGVTHGRFTINGWIRSAP